MRPAAAPRQEEGGNVPQCTTMGPQSQRRLTLQERTHQLQSESHRKKQKTGQQTLFGDRAFDPLKDCEVCKGKIVGRAVHRAHHHLCNNRRGGAKTKSTKAMEDEDKRLQNLFAAPLTEAEKCSGKCLTKEAAAGHFAPRAKSKIASSSSPAASFLKPMMGTPVNAEVFCKAVTTKVNNASFCQKHDNAKAPLAMVAFAEEVMEKIVNKKGVDIHNCFHGMTMTAPASEKHLDPHCHSVVGQKQLHVDWKRMFGLDVPCQHCKAPLQNDRTNFSKNKMLFPTFGLDGPPQWCVVQSVICKKGCWSRFDANNSAILCNLPAHAMSAYPVDAKHADGDRNSHVGRDATDVIDLLLPTCGNGELCSRLLCNAINRACVARAASCCSYVAECKPFGDEKCPPFIPKDGSHMRSCPPLGDTIRDMHDAACGSSNNPWKISDHDRHTREIQGVACSSIFAQDHTHEVTKNCCDKKKLGAEALWDVSAETGEIASAVLVPSTKTIHFSHAATQLAKRERFKPKAMHSDTWPCKSDYWSRLLGHEIKGRLGLFHCVQRMMWTLRKRYVDYFRAINSLLNAVYFYNHEDYEALLRALKDGTLSNTKCTDDDIMFEMKSTKTFRDRCGKHLRKEMRPVHSLRAKLDEWFHRFKCSTSSGTEGRPALGRLDPMTQHPLFTSETKVAWTNCMEKAEHLQDPLPLTEMYDVILPNENSKHGLKQHLSRRGESCLESFHLRLAHFANNGSMRNSLADNLNLTGTARYNLSIRHRQRLSSMSLSDRSKIPSAWEETVPHFNHSELAWVNELATKAGMEEVPFVVEPLTDDTGERFFSEHLEWMTATKPKHDPQDRCLCSTCGVVPATPMTLNESPQQPTPLNNNPLQQQPSELPIPADAQQQPNELPIPADAGVDNVTADVAACLPMPMQLTMMAPPVFFPFHCTPPQFGFNPWLSQNCCSRHRQWSTRPGRRGRPPHDCHCQRLAVSGSG